MVIFRTQRANSKSIFGAESCRDKSGPKIDFRTQKSAVIGARSSKRHEIYELILSQEARKRSSRSSCSSASLSGLVKNRLIHQQSHVYQQLDNIFLRREFLSSTAQLGYAKIALALLLRVIFFKNHSRRVHIGKNHQIWNT